MIALSYRDRPSPPTGCSDKGENVYVGGMTKQPPNSATSVLRTEHQLILAVAHSLGAKLAAEQNDTALDSGKP